MFRIVALLIAVLFAGCSDGVSPEPDEIFEGSFRLIEMTGASYWFGTPVTALEGSLELQEGEYAIHILWKAHPDFPANLHEQQGHYAARGTLIDLSHYENPMEVKGDTLLHVWSHDVTVLWVRSN